MESGSLAENNTGGCLQRASQAVSQEEETRQKRVEPGQRKENTTGLPDTLKVGIESLSGLSLDDVHVHYHSSKPTEVQALAYTQGTEIYVGPGQEQHLSHEAWHVVQQKQGRVKPTLQAKGVAINDDETLEREADAMGTRAAHRNPVEGIAACEQSLMTHAQQRNPQQLTSVAIPALVQRTIYSNGLPVTNADDVRGWYFNQTHNAFPNDLNQALETAMKAKEFYVDLAHLVLEDNPGDQLITTLQAYSSKQEKGEKQGASVKKGEKQKLDVGEGYVFLDSAGGVDTYVESHQGKHVTAMWPGYKGVKGAMFSSWHLSYSKLGLLKRAWETFPRRSLNQGQTKVEGYWFVEMSKPVDSNGQVTFVAIQWTWHPESQVYFIHAYPDGSKGKLRKRADAELKV